MIEVEIRGILSEGEYAALEQKLETVAEFLGEDNKLVEYHIYADKLLKIIRNDSVQNTVLSLKLKNSGQHSTQEYEVRMRHGDFDTLKNIIHSVTKPDQVIVGTQKRKNYKYKDVEIALKWSEDWGFHFEIEKLVESESEKDEALTLLRLVAEEFSVRSMSEVEEKYFLEKIRAKNKK